MRIQDEIFEDFLLKLVEDKDFPENTIEELKNLWDDENLSEEKILIAIARGIENRN